MKKSSYREPDYAFGQLMLSLRMATGLTQAALADFLGVSRNAIGGWEIGQSYPKAEHLKGFIALAHQQQVFAAGREAEEIRALWRAAHQKVLLDEPWLQELLSQQALPRMEVPVEQPSAASSDEIALWTVPYVRNPHFTGRDELLDQLMQQLAPPASGQPTTIRRAALTQAQVIKGLGGIGKTQTAVEYAYRAREQGRYTHTLWIAAASEEAILMSFAALAVQLPGVASPGETDQRKLVTAVIRWLEQCRESWLLIVDNADDLVMVQPYLPLKGNGSLLLTTRASATGWLASSLDVNAMGIMEGTELLLRRTGRFAQATDEEINEAGNLVVALAQFPLALDQAGAYIEETGCSLADYLQLYQTHRHVLLSRRGRQAGQYPASVASTWSLSFEHVEKANPAAAELLQLCAFLAPDGIPEELLTRGARHWPPALQEAATDRFRFNQALETLLAFSLVKRLSEDRLLSVHRLVQAVQVERLPAEEQRQWAERLVRAMNVVFPREPQETASWPACSRYLDQVQGCDLLLQEHHLTLPEAADLLARAGTYLNERALYALAEPLYRRALFIREQQTEAEPAGRAQVLYYLANLYADQGKYAQAEPLYWEVIGILEQQVVPEHVLLANSLRGLANLYNNNGQYAQAELLYRRALVMLEQQWGTDHPEIVGVLGGLAYVQIVHGKYAEAEQLYRRALRIQEQQYGPEHVQVAIPLIGLALIRTQQREYEQAEQHYRRALRIREQQYGPEHPQVAVTLHELAKMHTEQGNYAQAEALFQRALRIREQLYGPESRQAGDSLRGLANLYAHQGRDAEAEALYQRVLRIREQQMGAESSKVVAVLRELANLSTQQGKYQQAEPLYQRALRIVEQQLGPEHFETANVLHDFAGFHQTRGQIDEAALMYQRTLLIREHALGPSHPMTIDTRECLHAVLNQTEETAQREG